MMKGKKREEVEGIYKEVIIAMDHELSLDKEET